MNLSINKISTRVTSNEIAPLNIVDCLFSGNLPATNTHIPNKAARLKMFEPMMMPTPISCCLMNKAVTADEISGVAALNATSMPSNPPDTWKCNLSFLRLPLRIKLDIVIKTILKKNMSVANGTVINLYCPVSISNSEFPARLGYVYQMQCL